MTRSRPRSTARSCVRRLALCASSRSCCSPAGGLAQHAASRRSAPRRRRPDPRPTPAPADTAAALGVGVAHAARARCCRRDSASCWCSATSRAPRRRRRAAGGAQGADRHARLPALQVLQAARCGVDHVLRPAGAARRATEAPRSSLTDAARPRRAGVRAEARRRREPRTPGLRQVLAARAARSRKCRSEAASTGRARRLRQIADLKDQAALLEKQIQDAKKKVGRRHRSGQRSTEARSGAAANRIARSRI